MRPTGRLGRANRLARREAAPASPLIPASPADPSIASITSITSSDSAGFGGFRLGALHLALPMAALREVVPRGTLMALPCRSDCIAGGVDLRGVIVPVLDLGRLLGRDAAAGAQASVIVIMVHEARLLGLLADAVTGVFTHASRRHGVSLPGVDASLFECCIESADGVMSSVLSPTMLAALPQVPTVDDPEAARRLAGGADVPAEPDSAGAASATVAVPMMLMRGGRVALAIEAIAVHATLSDPRVRDSALARGDCRGVLDYAGAELPAIDLLAFCRLGELRPDGPRQAFVVELQNGRVAFLIERIVDIVDRRPADVIALPGFALPRADLFRGVLAGELLPAGTDATTAFVVDPDALRRCDEVIGWAGFGAGPANGDANTGSKGEASAGRPAHTMLTYQLGTETATPLEQVSEILAYDHTGLLFDNGGPLLSVLVNRGRSIPVMCLSRLTNCEPPKAVPGVSVLVVECDGEWVGFVVPALRAIEPARWEPALPAGPGGQARPLALVGQGEMERMLPVLDLQQVARSMRPSGQARVH